MMKIVHCVADDRASLAIALSNTCNYMISNKDKTRAEFLCVCVVFIPR